MPLYPDIDIQRVLAKAMVLAMAMAEAMAMDIVLPDPITFVYV